MPVPTEQLDADIRELDRRLSSRLDAVDRSLADAREDLSEFREEFASFRGSTETHLRLIRWVGALFSGCMLTVFASIVSLTWHASAVNTEVKGLVEGLRETRATIKELGDETRAEFKKLGAEVQKLNADVQELRAVTKESGARLDRIEHQLEAVIKTTKP
jgi:septal ring factor EnvC (AmiA/AmiB activator)